MKDSDRLFTSGIPNPTKFGLSLRSSAGSDPDPITIETVAARLGRPACYTDDNGYDCELIGGAISAFGDVGYVESRAKDVGFNQYGANQREIDITIRVHLVSHAGQHQSADIESYNPFFGCDVRLFEWIDHTAILIYREKHDTYACKFGDIWPPKFVQIEDCWIIAHSVLAFVGYKEKVVRRLSFPELENIGPLPIAEAERIGQLPPTRQRAEQGGQPERRIGRILKSKVLGRRRVTLVVIWLKSVRRTTRRKPARDSIARY